MATNDQLKPTFDGTPALMLMTALTADQVRTCVRNARSPAYWRKLNRQLSVSDKLDFGKVKARSITPGTKRAALTKLEAEGYCQLDSVYPDSLMHRIRQGIETLARENWPPVFIYVYDECWLMKRIPSLTGLLDAMLGRGHMELRNVWAHYIRPLPGAHGWVPHMDGPFIEERASAWFPITDATLDNGCIYIVPQGRIPARLTDNFHKIQSFTNEDLKLLMQAARALPVRAGSMLAWNFRVVHWGSVAGRTKKPRISLATEFVSATAPHLDNDMSPLDAHSTIPSFDVRLEIIGRGVWMFAGFEPKLLRHREVGAQLWAGSSSGLTARRAGRGGQSRRPYFSLRI